MGTRLILVPELGLRGNKRLQSMLVPYMHEHAYLSASQIARRWVADQEFWAPGTWLEGLMARADRAEVITRAIALLICHEEEARFRRQRRHGRPGLFRIGHLGRMRGGAHGAAFARGGGRAFR